MHAHESTHRNMHARMHAHTCTHTIITHLYKVLVYISERHVNVCIMHNAATFDVRFSVGICTYACAWRVHVRMFVHVHVHVHALGVCMCVCLACACACVCAWFIRPAIEPHPIDQRTHWSEETALFKGERKTKRFMVAAQSRSEKTFVCSSASASAASRLSCRDCNVAFSPLISTTVPDSNRSRTAST